MWHVYIVKCADKTFYTGIAKDLKKRLSEHNSSGLGAKYTRGRWPVKLIYSAKIANHSRALKKEWAIKKMTREQKKELIKNK